MNRFWRRLTYANVVASLSLFLALGGGAYAAVAVTSEDIVDETIQSQDIGAEAVRTADIGKQAVTLDRMHDHAVNSAKVLDNSLSGPDVANGSLTHWDIADNSLTGSEIADGSLTTDKLADDSVRGAKVRNGSLNGLDLADDSVLGRQIDLDFQKFTERSEESTHAFKHAEARCPAGYTMLAGGARTTFRSDTGVWDGDTDAWISNSAPSRDGQGWHVEAVKNKQEDIWPWWVTAYVFCARL
jgi:hypothetical protein